MKICEYENSISMLEFLINYVGLTDITDEETIKKLKYATHRDIKELNIPYVKAIPFEAVTKEDLKTGGIIYVYDGKSTRRNKRVAPYIRPEILRMNEEKREGSQQERKILVPHNMNRTGK